MTAGRISAVVKVKPRLSTNMAATCRVSLRADSLVLAADVLTKEHIHSYVCICAFVMGEVI
jgi:hypothetical protein